MSNEIKTFKVKIEAPGYTGIKQVEIARPDDREYFDWEYDAEFAARLEVKHEGNHYIHDVHAIWTKEI